MARVFGLVRMRRLVGTSISPAIRSLRRGGDLLRRGRGVMNPVILPQRRDGVLHVMHDIEPEIDRKVAQCRHGDSVAQGDGRAFTISDGVGQKTAEVPGDRRGKKQNHVCDARHEHRPEKQEQHILPKGWGSDEASGEQVTQITQEGSRRNGLVSAHGRAMAKAQRILWTGK